MMQAERWRQIEELYHAALERAPDERAHFLAESCADSTLRQEIESLLAYNECDEEFLTSPPDEIAAALFAAESPVGKSLGHYRILELLGQGGMGEVYRARDERLGREVAVKLLPAAFASDSDRLRRFEREARAASALNHPNILTIYEISQADTAHYIVSELVEGETLRQRMMSGPLRIEAALEIAAQVASALEAAHRAGIVHRDIKPENVMLRPDGLIKVLDFGLAKHITPPVAAGASDPLIAPQVKTDSGMILGTVSYMSPEQARGQKADERTDIFSFGVMLYEMLAGRRPFEGATASDVIAALLTTEPPPLRSIVSQTPKELEQITQKCLAKEREERWQSARELLNLLKSLQTVNQADGVTASRRAEVFRPGFWLWRWPVAVALAAVLIIGLGWFLSWRRAAAVEPAQIRSLAVLPLANLSGDPQQEYFADGMTEALISNLTQVRALRVISRTSVMRFKGNPMPLAEIARELNVEAVIEGSVQRDGGRVKITARLIQATDETPLRSFVYERELADVLAAQSEVAQAITREINVAVTPQEQARLARVRQVQPEAYQAYLKARFIWNKRTTETLEAAVEHFERAIGLDAKYAPAYAGLADAYSMLSDYDVLTPREAYPKARAAAQQALALDAELAEAHTSLAWIRAAYEWNFAEAEQAFQRALALNPNYATAHQWYGEFLSACGRHQEAIAELKFVQQLEPFSLNVGAALAGAYYFARQDEQALAECRKVIELDPNFAQVYDWLRRTYENRGMAREALTAHQKHIELMGLEAKYVEKIRRAGSPAGMQDYWRKRLTCEMQTSSPFPFWIAECQAQLGRKEQAFAWLEKLCEDRSYWAIYLNVVPTLDPLRSDPRFTNLLRRIGLDQ
jgi:serine/threonine-protein kinase